ncbi:MAG: type II toxin-antitoxin system VapC family toxin [Desulfococcaceae bacterium]
MIDRDFYSVFSEIERIGFDTSPIIYFAELHPVYFPLVRHVIRRIDEGNLKGFGSVVTLTQVLVLPRREGRRDLENQYRDILQNSRNFELVAIDAEIAEQASDLRCRHNLRTPDALQVSAALSRDCDAFLTNDKKLKKIDNLKVLVLDDFVQPFG